MYIDSGLVYLFQDGYDWRRLLAPYYTIHHRSYTVNLQGSVTITFLAIPASHKVFLHHLSPLMKYCYLLCWPCATIFHPTMDRLPPRFAGLARVRLKSRNGGTTNKNNIGYTVYMSTKGSVASDFGSFNHISYIRVDDFLIASRGSPC